jgi:hypothetical protein
MRKYHFWIPGLFLCVAIVFAQELPRTLPSIKKFGYYGAGSRPELLRRTSFIDGKQYLSILEQPADGRDWESSSPLPIPLSEAEKAARVELGKIVPDQTGWIATDFQISRFAAGQGWYYVVTLKPVVRLSGERSDSFSVLLDVLGKAGRVLQLGAQQVQR